MKRLSAGFIASIAMIILVSAATASATTFCTKGPGDDVRFSTGACGQQDLVINIASSADVTALSARVTTLESKVAALEAANTELQTRLRGVTRNGSTLVFNAMNLELENGLNSTNTTNGLGNLIIGYNETPGSQTGSHNLVFGHGQTFTSFGGTVGGINNQITAPWASVLDGHDNHAAAGFSAVLGGINNLASASNASVSGGSFNIASGNNTSVSGGLSNLASAENASVSGGKSNTASGTNASVSGGDSNIASGSESSIFGGLKNNVTTLDGTKP